MTNLFTRERYIPEFKIISEHLLQEISITQYPYFHGSTEVLATELVMNEPFFLNHFEDNNTHTAFFILRKLLIPFVIVIFRRNST